MQKLLLTGGARLCGTAEIHGAKNSALPILAACCLCSGTCVLHNCPEILDVTTACEILKSLGAQVCREKRSLIVDTRGLKDARIGGALAGKMRSSVIFSGALLARCGWAELALPGGCPLGARPIDLHVKALQSLGARVELSRETITAQWEKPQSAEIFLPFPSVGATENILLAGALGNQTVCVHGAACEPEIEDLANFLCACGAEITGAGTKTITICGVEHLHGAEYTILPDRIETATCLCAVAGCGGDAEFQKTDAALLEPVVSSLRQAGCRITTRQNTIRIQSGANLKAPEPVITAPYPGFPTDAQAVMMAAVLKAEGESLFQENIFEQRFWHVPEFLKLGAKISLRDKTATVQGVRELHGAALSARDLRGAAALLIAGMMAEGESSLVGLEHLRRGYENLEETFKNLGANIKSVDIPAPFVYNNAYTPAKEKRLRSGRA